MALKNTARQFSIPFVKKTLRSDKELEEVIQERTTVYLEQAYRNFKQFEKTGAKRMMPLIDSLIKSDDEKLVLGSILHQFYWKTFTGNEGTATAPEAPVEEENSETPAA